jgi:hypothetical protein
VDKFAAKINAKLKKLQQDRDATEEHYERKTQLAIDKALAVQ